MAKERDLRFDPSKVIPFDVPNLNRQGVKTNIVRTNDGSRLLLFKKGNREMKAFMNPGLFGHGKKFTIVSPQHIAKIAGREPINQKQFMEISFEHLVQNADQAAIDRAKQRGGAIQRDPRTGRPEDRSRGFGGTVTTAPEWAEEYFNIPVSKGRNAPTRVFTPDADPSTIARGGQLSGAKEQAEFADVHNLRLSSSTLDLLNPVQPLTSFTDKENELKKPEYAEQLLELIQRTNDGHTTYEMIIDDAYDKLVLKKVDDERVQDLTSNVANASTTMSGIAPNSAHLAVPLNVGKQTEPTLTVKSSNKGETELIKKIDGKWRIRSGNTGKLWPQKYDTAEDAHAAMSAYHAN